MKILYRYQNGNTFTELYEDGTKIRKYEGSPIFSFAESVDVKISNYCDLGCRYCHESSTKEGKHGNIIVLLEVLKEADLPEGIELAFGGGNPLDHPQLEHLLIECKKMGFVCNLTVNQGHLKSHKEILSKIKCYINGLGISVTTNNFKEIINLDYEHIVYHLIAGVNDIDIMDKLIGLREKTRVLVLGYKDYGFGVGFRTPDVDKKILKWSQQLPTYFGKCILSFDNLAIEQLDVKRFFTEKGYNEFYMGDDFTHSCYIDAVEGCFAPTSRDKNKSYFKDGWNMEKFWGTRIISN